MEEAGIGEVQGGLPEYAGKAQSQFLALPDLLLLKVLPLRGPVQTLPGQPRETPTPKQGSGRGLCLRGGRLDLRGYPRC